MPSIDKKEESKEELKEELKEVDNSDELERVYKDITTKKYCKTDILNNLSFESEIDKYVFDFLPLSNSQKEQLLLNIYKEKNI